MNATSKRAASSGIFGDPGAIAPTVDKRWRDDFIVELRLLSVSGDRIGDALMTVETHVSESGESAQEAFGGAKAYAQEVAESTGAAGSGGVITVWTAAGTVLGLLGMLGTMRAFTSWLEGTSVTVTVGELVGLVVLLALAGLLLTGRPLRALVEHRWLAFVLPIVLVGGLVVLFVLLSEPLFEVPTAALGVVAVLLLVASTAISWFDGPGKEDEITAPGQTPAPGNGIRLLTAAILPAMTVFILGFSWVLHRVTG